ncbi:MAG TPA: hypothetical protein VGA70_08730 [Longimicrobiales bacterium]|jgi:opacity protein-like surface antigen
MIPIRRSVALLALPAAALAFGAGAGEAQQRPDFLFRQPAATLSVRAGYAMPSENGEIFDFVRSELTLGEGDFGGFVVAGDLSVRVTERVDLLIGAGFSQVEKDSEFREWVDLDDRPIEQNTLLSRLPVTIGAKVYFKDRGRSIGRFAWIPADWVPYVGAAGGWTRFHFEQAGDFVDFETLDVFPYTYVSEGWASTWAVLSGIDWSLNPRVALRAEARYLWSSGDLGVDFENFDPIDLGGLDASVGFAFRL